MKKATLVLLAIAFLAGLPAVASAKPFDVQELGNDHHWKHNGPSSGLDMKEHSYGVGWANFGKNTGDVGFTPDGGPATWSPVIHTTTLVAGVPEGGSSLPLLGAGLVVLVLTYRLWRRLAI